MRKIQDRKTWRGTRHGFRIEIEHESQLNFSRNPIRWKIRLDSGWLTGHSPTVWEAVQDLESAAAAPRPAKAS
jgi:hypothetical protein